MALRKGAKRLAGAILLPLLLLQACGNSTDAPDVSAVHVDLQLRRLDRDLAAIDTAQLQAGVAQALAKYPRFLPFYVSRLLPFVIDDPALDSVQRITASVGHMLTDRDLRGVFDTVAAHFPDTKQEERQLVRGFQYMKHYFPDYRVPEVICFVSGLNNWTAITYEDSGKVLGIGLDMFLGKNYPYYASVGIPDYMTRRLSPEYIVVNAFRAVYEELYPFAAEGRTLLGMMLQRGKAQYFLQQVLPFVPDTLQFGYTKAQLDWCTANEAMVYNFFIRENLVYETNWQKVLRYVNDGPNSTGMPQESPGNIGTWLGTRIIEAYVQQHPGLTLPQLLGVTDAQQILREAKYKPR